MKKENSVRRAVTAIFLSIILGISSIPMYVSANETEDIVDASQQAITDMLEAGNYVEGEVLAIVYSKYADTEDWFTDTQASDETMGTVTAQEYAAANEELVEDVQSEDEELSIISIQSDVLSTREMMERLWDDSRVVSVEPNLLMMNNADEVTEEIAEAGEIAETEEIAVASDNSTIPDLTSYQWGMKNNGATNYDAEAKTLGLSDENAPYSVNVPGWPDGEENAAGVIAIIDDGIDLTHPDLENVVIQNMQDYTTEGGPNGINLSGEGDLEDISDYGGHGTHVAGIIAAAWDGSGISGVANGVKILPIRIYKKTGEISMSQAVKAYEYLATAMDGGLNLVAINNSWGDRQMTKVLSTIVTKLGKKALFPYFRVGMIIKI